LSPIVTAGLPAPGPLAGEVEVDDALELDDEELLLLPHAAKPTLNALTANSAAALPPAVLNLLHRVPGIYAASCFDLFIRKLI
jgi:hypothetical protein